MITPEQTARERTIVYAIAMDTAIVVSQAILSVVTGSLTLIAETIRSWLGYFLECFTFVLLRRIHRGVLVDMEYGSGKLEQVANVIIGISMLIGSLWITVNAIKAVVGLRELGTPFGLAIAAILGAVNALVNVLAWDAMRRTAAGTPSLIIDAQLKLRWVKMWSSAVVLIAMTVSALSTDDVIVGVADGLGSLFVAGYLLVSAIGVLKAAIPDLLDRSAGQTVRETVVRALEAHAGSYVKVNRLRTRKSGLVTFIEVAIAFDPALSIVEVDTRVEALKSAVRQTLPDAEIAVLASSAAAA